MLTLIIDLVLTYISTVAFGIILNIPRRALNTSGWIGLLSFLAYKLYLMAGGGIVGGNFLGALLIGILSMQAARWLKMPVINFNIPSLVPFVPGGQAYQMVKKLCLG
ncbi:threonine/serine exporter family protein [Secundilactobacillus collinoides]|uniref:threonine/serine exporter family protein n=1 Tax=Secundilactobacillus collinoides TaxID=33960 RepID=UPI000B20E48F